MVKRCQVCWGNLDPAIGTEIRKTRPALIISPDDMNAILPRVIVAPLTSKGQPLGCRPEVEFKGKPSRILLDQIRAVDKQRLGAKMGDIALEQWHPALLEMLA
jgi:mRNA interferase MazF